MQRVLFLTTVWDKAEPRAGSRDDPLKWDNNELLDWATKLHNARGNPILRESHVNTLRKNLMEGSHLPTLTAEKLMSDGLPRGPAESFVAAVQKLIGPPAPISVEVLVDKIVKKGEQRRFPKQQPVQRYGFVDRPGFDTAARRVIERNVLAFESGKQHPNDYAYAVFAGGSGMGKTIGGFELADRIRTYRPNYHVVHAFMLPDASPFSSQLQPPLGWKKADGRPRGEVEPSKDPVALGLAAWFFWNNSSPEAQYELLSLDSGCANLPRVVEAIRFAGHLDEAKPLLIVLQLDEFQDAWYTSLLMLRSIRTWIRGNMISKKCLIIPVLSGTAPASLTAIESLTSTNSYGSEIYSMSPLTLAGSATLAARYATFLKESGLSKHTFNFTETYASNPFYQEILNRVGGVPKLVEMLVDTLLSGSLSSVLKTVDHAMDICNSLSRAISRRYQLDRILAGLGGGDLGHACLRELAALSYFEVECNRETELNGATIGDMETSGILFLLPLPPPADLDPENKPEERFLVKLPLILHFYFASVIPEWASLFSKQLLRGGMSLSEDTFPEFIVHMHRATYTLLTWRRGWTDDPTATLRLIYNGAAISLGDQRVLDRKFLVSKGVDFRYCPQRTTADGPEYGITNVRSVTVMSPSKEDGFDAVDITSGRWLVMTRKRAPEVDALTPHGREQYKFSGYLASGLPIPDKPGKPDTTVFITKSLLESEKAQGVVWEDSAFILISPKNLISPAKKLVLNQSTIDPAEWFGQEKVLVVCGWDAVLKFTRGFLSELALPKHPPCAPSSENGPQVP